MDDPSYGYIIYGRSGFSISIKNMKQDYPKFPDKKLEDLLKDLKFKLMQSSGSKVEGLKKKFNIKKIKKEIARIKTEQTRRLKNNE